MNLKENPYKVAPAVSLAQRLLFLLIILISLIIRLIEIDNPVYDYNAWRQTETAALAHNYYVDNPPFLYPEIDWVGPHGHAEMEFPLFPYLVSWIYTFTGPDDMWGRLLTVFCALGALWAMWDAARRAAQSNWAGIFAIALFTVSPLTIFFGRTFQPDMMMVLFSTLSINFLMRWDGSPKNPWLYVSALSLSLGALLKPPCLIVAFPLVYLAWQQSGKKILIRKETFIYLAIVLVPALLWYTHARGFYEETQASFMWHNHFTFDLVFLAFWTSESFWDTVWYRFNEQILVETGFIPFAIGMVRMFFPHPARPLAWTWLMGMAVLYLGTPEHHMGHDYYSLLAVPPVIFTAAMGCLVVGQWLYARIAVTPGIVLILPVIMGVLSFNYLEDRGWYNKLYTYYDDAVSLKDRLPDDATILVMDDILHTPEFFYFSDRVGWHRYRNYFDFEEDSAWLEKYREKGAAFYIGMTEDAKSNPLRYLLDHPMGQYIRSHYKLWEVGAAYFIADLTKPHYGDHIFLRFQDQTLAVSEGLKDTAMGLRDDILPLQQWYNADVLIMDFHNVTPDRLKRYETVYEAVINDGYGVTHQNSGRLVLQKDVDFEPVSNFVSNVVTTQTENRINDNNQALLGILKPGQYRLSFAIDPARYYEKLTLKAIDLNGNLISGRTIDPNVLKHIRERQNPELFFTLKENKGVMATVTNANQIIEPLSVVCMPDIQCVTPYQVLQAEQLIPHRSELVKDPDAHRGSAIQNDISQERSVITIGPYFDLPAGQYEFSYRLRVAQPVEEGLFTIGMHRSDDSHKTSREFQASFLESTYNQYSVRGEIQGGYDIESRLYASPGLQLFFDTVAYKIKRRGLREFSKEEPFYFTTVGDELWRITETGDVYDSNNNPLSEFFMGDGLITATASSAGSGAVVLDEKGNVFNQNHQQITKLAPEIAQNARRMAISPDGLIFGVLTHDGEISYVQDNTWFRVILPPRDFQPVDLLIENDGGVLVLFSSGEIFAHGQAEVPPGVPNFWSDAARSLIRFQDGVYMVDKHGGIHTSEGVPPVQTPLYNPEPWVDYAVRTNDGRWFLKSEDSEIRSFKEPAKTQH